MPNKAKDLLSGDAEGDTEGQIEREEGESDGDEGKSHVQKAWKLHGYEGVEGPPKLEKKNKIIL